MLEHLEQAIFYIMGQPVVMGVWVGFTTMIWLLRARVHRFRSWGEFRLFGTSAIIGIALPIGTMAFGGLLHSQLQGIARTIIVILSTPIIITLAFVLTVTLVQRFVGADAETSMQLAWPITIITYVIPLVICFGYSLTKDTWLNTTDSEWY